MSLNGNLFNLQVGLNSPNCYFTLTLVTQLNIWKGHLSLTNNFQCLNNTFYQAHSSRLFHAQLNCLQYKLWLIDIAVKSCNGAHYYINWLSVPGIIINQSAFTTASMQRHSEAWLCKYSINSRKPNRIWSPWQQQIWQSLST